LPEWKNEKNKNHQGIIGIVNDNMSSPYYCVCFVNLKVTCKPYTLHQDSKGNNWFEKCHLVHISLRKMTTFLID
jgi:hypothetical protein